MASNSSNITESITKAALATLKSRSHTHSGPVVAEAKPFTSKRLLVKGRTDLTTALVSLIHSRLNSIHRTLGSEAGIIQAVSDVVVQALGEGYGFTAPLSQPIDFVFAVAASASKRSGIQGTQRWAETALADVLDTIGDSARAAWDEAELQNMVGKMSLTGGSLVTPQEVEARPLTRMMAALDGAMRGDISLPPASRPRNSLQDNTKENALPNSPPRKKARADFITPPPSPKPSRLEDEVRFL
ncbi:hypothetical protein DFH06DRAFT_1175954 [Mycena polygramma]|nr:hypothetical protein DFH06DRAFT_1175954 [Mycena polygramma]